MLKSASGESAHGLTGLPRAGIGAPDGLPHAKSAIMKIFVVNCGSSSIKYRLFDMGDESVLARGVLERVGGEGASLRHEAGGRTVERAVDAADHAAGMRVVIETLTAPDIGVLSGVEEIDGVGHRAVHGGEEITGSTRIDDRVLDVLRRNSELAPLHNPPNLAGIEAALRAIPDAAQMAVFDTAFLTTLPPRAFRYAVPEDWYTRYHVRKYGFHGTSHRYVTLTAAERLGCAPGQVDLITAHLGNGCSVTAVQDGRAVDHSMGMTPLEGLVMGTRCGDIDPAIPLHMQGRGLSAEEVDRALNKESGLLALSGRSNDMRDLLTAAGDGDERAELAVEVFVYRLARYIGAYRAVLPRLDALVLTGGIGENSSPVRARVCRMLSGLGVRLDTDRNERTVGGQCGPITADDSDLSVWVIPTNEELMIARDTRDLIAAGGA